MVISITIGSVLGCRGHRVIEKSDESYAGFEPPYCAQIYLILAVLVSTVAMPRLHSPDLPLEVFDAYFLPCFLIVVKPLSLLQVNAGKLSVRFYACG